MQLHRSKDQPEWNGLSADNQNSWQRSAQRTNGVVTPGNIITVIGFTTALAGIVAITKEHYWYGFVGLLTGRLLDIADGWAADFTSTKSPLGEALDASVDKLITLLTLIVLGVTHTAPAWIIVGILLPHLLISLLAGQAVLKGKRLHPSRYGKLSMAAAWASLVGFVATRAANANLYLNGISYILGFISIVLAVIALAGYLQSSKSK
ncbi:CDP-alcohol phosphatidyltransferase family protein [Polaromonas sp.]|nr:CDP-alcohol phosphatidyltransferase family protein [Candidatus Saccharibacteria bacterium]